ADPRLIANAWNDLGAVYERLGRYEEAKFSLDEARVIREQSGQGASLGTTFDLLGLVYEGLGQPDSARIWYEQALEITTARGDRAAGRRALERALHVGDSLADPGIRAGALVALAAAARADGDAERASLTAGEALDAGAQAGDSSAVHDAASLLATLDLERR